MKLLSLFSLILLALSWTEKSEATTQHGVSLELGVGYSQYSLSDQTQKALYSGISSQGRALFPLLSSGLFSIDFDLSYQYLSLENNASNNTLSEWSHVSGFGGGLRFNYSYLFAGIDYLMLEGQHVRAGTVNDIFQYHVKPLQWQAGLALPVSPITSITFSYSQMIPTDFSVEGASFKVTNQAFWIRFQIDFGVSFFNLLNPEKSFEPTRNGFFVN